MINKTILVTGASGGIGSILSEQLLEEGANVVAQYHTQNEILLSMQEKYGTDRIFPFKADLRQESDVVTLFKRASMRFNTIHSLVNNAGIWPPIEKFLWEMTLEQWENTFAVNLKSTFLCTREFLRLQQEIPYEKPSIVLIGSTAGIFGEAGHADYSATKAAMRGLMLSLKNEIPKVSRFGRVNIVNPGWVKTIMAKESLNDEKTVTKVLQTIALRKVALPHDIASLVIFLLSDKLSGHISGQSIDVTGGMEGRLLYQPDQIDLSKV